MKLFAVTGNPISFSYSPNIFNTFFEKNKNDARYIRISSSSAKEAITIFKELNLSGMSVTAPFKTEIINYLDQIDELAKNIGSVNTIIKKDNKLIGYNTDYYGIINSLPEVKNKNILILGAGGAAKAVVYSLKKNAANITISNRTTENAKKLSDKFKVSHIKPENISTIIENIDIIINTIPNKIKLIDDNLLSSKHIIFDAIYNNSVYEEVASTKSIKFINGKIWLLNQAIPAYKLFLNETITINEKEINFTPKQKDKIILVGFMGSGKSTIAEKLSEKLNIKYFSTDVIISVKEGKSINEIFESKGEKYFREMEEQILSMLSTFNGNGIVSTGGGVVLSETNRKIIFENYTAIWLYANTKSIMSRTEPENRPLLKNNFTKERVKELMSERINHYYETADLLINTNNKSIDEVIKDLLNNLSFGHS